MELSTKAVRQLDVIRGLSETLSSAGIGWWLFGGWGLDARLGRVTREHGDVEFWIDDRDGAHCSETLAAAGCAMLPNLHPEESQEFTCGETPFSSAYFVPEADGTYSVRGRWDDWRFPVGSFGSDRGTLGDLAVPAMSLAGMLAMKQQFASLRNGRPLREKDIADIELLRRLLGGERC